MQYSFDMGVAQRYGLPEAVFVHRLYWWVRDNAANGRNYRDGHYWTYDSLNALTEIFPCWSRRQLQGIIARCREKGLILTAAYNKSRGDSTTWFTVTEAVIQAYGPIKPGVPERCQGEHETVPGVAPNGATGGTKRCRLYKEQLEDQLEDEREGAPAQEEPTKPEEDGRKGYGEFGNVRLTDDEIARLTARWTPNQVAAEIEALSAYMASKGKRYRDHYATLLGWFKKDHPPVLSTGRVVNDED